MEWKDKIKGIIFDLDGVIVDTAKYHYIAWKNLASDLGIEFTEKENEHLKGVSRIESLEYILNLGNIQMDAEQKQKLAARKNSEYLELIKNLDQDEMLPGVMDWLTSCKERNIRIALGSASKNAKGILEALDLTGWFDAIIDGTSTNKAKPDPEVFLMAADNLALKPDQCVVIEDSLKGLEAAERGGFHSIGIGDPKILNKTNIVLKDLSESDINILSNFS